MRPLKVSRLTFGLILISAIFCGCSANQPALPAATAKVYTDWPFDAKEAVRRQDETAKALGIPKELTLDLGNKVTMKLVLIPAGTFMMGSPKDEKERSDEEVQHEVAITKPFYMGAYHVTKGQFAAFVAESGCKTDAEKIGWSLGWDGKQLNRVDGASWKKPSFDQTDDHPIVCVSHNDAVAFCNWLSKKTGKAVTLPTEAQWEYACRAGTATAYQWGDDPNDDEGWCNALDQTAQKTLGEKRTCFSWDDGYTFTSPVGKFKPNAFGVYDMHGNVYQWCADWYDKDYYAQSPKADPEGPSAGDSRVLRGSSWTSDPRGSRSGSRNFRRPVSGHSIFGFRVVVTVPD